MAPQAWIAAMNGPVPSPPYSRQALLRARPIRKPNQAAKAHLKSDRTSCRSPLANQVRLILHTAAYWLMLTVRDDVPKTQLQAKVEFATLRIRPLKIGARIRETAYRVRIAFATACPDVALVRDMTAALRPASA